MMLGLIVLSTLSGATPAAPLSAADVPAEATSSVITDLTQLPLHILKRLPSPVDYDYDGDGKLDPLGIELDAKGFLQLKITSSRTKKQQILYKASESMTSLKAKAFGMKLDGGPDTGIDLSLWGIADRKRVAPLIYSIKPSGLRVFEGGKPHDVRWSGSAFVVK